MLLEEFPDVSISKIRFLESQGLIDPERTPSGYRKFYDADVDRLRVILREQRQNFLPLRVIRDRLESGRSTTAGPMTPPHRALRSARQHRRAATTSSTRRTAVPRARRVDRAPPNGPATRRGKSLVHRRAAVAERPVDRDHGRPRQRAARQRVVRSLASPSRSSPISSRTACCPARAGVTRRCTSSADVAIATAAAGFLERGVAADTCRRGADPPSARRRCSSS